MSNRLSALAAPLLGVFLVPACAGQLCAASTGGPTFGPAGTLLWVTEPSSPTAPARGRSDPFPPGVQVNDDQSPEHREPSVVWSPDGVLFAAYCERSSHYNPEWVVCTRSQDGGLTWRSTAVRVNDTTPNAVLMPALGIMSDGSLVVAWGEMKFGPSYNNEIRFARSVDGGDHWSPSVVVHPINPAINYYRPSLVVAGGRILVSYWREVGYPNALSTVVWSDDAGANWSAPVTVSSLLCVEDGAGPGLAWNRERGEVGLVLPASDHRIVFCRSTDAGEHWSAAVQVSDAPGSNADTPDLFAAQGLYHVVWSDNRAGQYDTDIYYSQSADGVAFSSSRRVNDALEGNQYEPHLSVDPAGTIHVCWIWNLPFQSNIDLYYARSEDGGTTWLSPCPRVNDVAYAVQPYVAWTSDLVSDTAGVTHLFWNDGRESGYYDDVYCTRTADPAMVTDGTASRARLDLRLVGSPGSQPRFVVQAGSDRPISGSGVELAVFDARGRRLQAGVLALNSREVGDVPVWRVFQRRLCPPGVYFVRACLGSESVTRKLVVIE